MFRTPAALLLLSAVSSSLFADDPLIPGAGGPTLGLSPLPPASAAPLSAAPAIGAPTTIHSHDPQANYRDPSGAEMPLSGVAPLTTDASTEAYSSMPAYGSAPVASPSAPMLAMPAAGCGCQGGTLYSAGAAALPATMPYMGAGYGADFGLGYDALGYAGGTGGYTGAFAAGMHVRHPYYSYRRPWYANGPMSHNVSIAW